MGCGKRELFTGYAAVIEIPLALMQVLMKRLEHEDVVHRQNTVFGPTDVMDMGRCIVLPSAERIRLADMLDETVGCSRWDQTRLCLIFWDGKPMFGQSSV